MEKPIMTEEQARNIYRFAICENGLSEECFIKNMKYEGYIRKTIIEEAEEMYKEIKKVICSGSIIQTSEIHAFIKLADKQHEAIQKQSMKIQELEKKLVEK